MGFFIDEMGCIEQGTLFFVSKVANYVRALLVINIKKARCVAGFAEKRFLSLNPFLIVGNFLYQFSLLGIIEFRANQRVLLQIQECWLINHD